MENANHDFAFGFKDDATNWIKLVGRIFEFKLHRDIVGTVASMTEGELGVESERTSYDTLG